MKEIFVAGIIISFSESLKKGHIGTDVPTEPPSHPPPPKYAITTVLLFMVITIHLIK